MVGYDKFGYSQAIGSYKKTMKMTYAEKSSFMSLFELNSMSLIALEIILLAFLEMLCRQLCLYS